MSESFTYSTSARKEVVGSPRCFSCERPIRDWECGYVDTGLCEDCQVEAEEQAKRDDAACYEWSEEAGHHVEVEDIPHCMNCGREVREWVPGYVDTSLCAECQVEFEKQVERDDTAWAGTNEEQTAREMISGSVEALRQQPEEQTVVRQLMDIPAHGREDRIYAATNNAQAAIEWWSEGFATYDNLKEHLAAITAIVGTDTPSEARDALQALVDGIDNTQVVAERQAQRSRLEKRIEQVRLLQFQLDEVAKKLWEIEDPDDSEHSLLSSAQSLTGSAASKLILARGHYQHALDIVIDSLK